jgi:DNA-binding transcriptional LysR family regulator
MMNERHLLYVMEIAKEGNITAAAQNLFITQPSLSNLLTSIEKELGAKLFDRSVSPMTLTCAGEKYIEAAEKIMGQLQELRHQINDMNDSFSGRLHIGCGPQLSSFLVPVILPVLMEQYPGIQFKLTEAGRETLEERLINGTLDVLLSSGIINHQRIECIPLIKQEIILLAPDNFKPRAVKEISGRPFPCIDLRACGTMPMVLMKKGHQTRIIQDRIFFENHCMPNIILETDNAYTCLHMVERGIAFSILPNMKIKQNIKKIEGFSFEKEYYHQISLCYRNNAYFPKIVGAFIQVTRAVLQSQAI